MSIFNYLFNHTIHKAEYGRISFTISTIFGFLGITLTELEAGLKIVLLVISILSGLLALSYYYLARKEKKLQIKIHNNDIKKHDEKDIKS